MKNLLSRLAMANGANARLCHLAKEEIQRWKAKADLVTISKAKFQEATGRPPVDDDLERSNCSKRGATHTSCGWCTYCDLPFFQCGGIHK